jgi:hypothetical protein
VRAAASRLRGADLSAVATVGGLAEGVPVPVTRVVKERITTYFQEEDTVGENIYGRRQGTGGHKESGGD